MKRVALLIVLLSLLLSGCSKEDEMVIVSGSTIGISLGLSDGEYIRIHIPDNLSVRSDYYRYISETNGMFSFTVYSNCELSEVSKSLGISGVFDKDSMSISSYGIFNGHRVLHSVGSDVILLDVSKDCSSSLYSVLSKSLFEAEVFSLEGIEGYVHENTIDKVPEFNTTMINLTISPEYNQIYTYDYNDGFVYVTKELARYDQKVKQLELRMIAATDNTKPKVYFKNDKYYYNEVQEFTACLIHEDFGTTVCLWGKGDIARNAIRGFLNCYD